MFTEEEAAVLVLGLLGTAWLELAQSAGVVEGTLAKISRVLPLATREKLKDISSHLYFSASLPQTRPDVTSLITVSQAIGQQQRIALDYRSLQDQLTHRKVEPYGVVGWNGHWYLVAYCCLRQDYRTFRLDRIEQLEVLAETFERVEAFDYRTFMLEQPATSPGNFRLKVEFQASLFTIRQKIPASYGSLTPVANGVVFESNYEDLTDMARYLISLGLPFVIHHPVELRQALLELAEKMVQFATAPTVSNQAGSSRGN
jgi:predicted DNA-binding transcriptional regulator YafY